MRVILASGSPRRKSLLESIGLNFTVYHPDVNEEHFPNELPSDLCARLSRLKAQAGLKEFPDDVIIAADTIVVIGGEILGKPHDHEDASRMLHHLSGKTHEVITGLCVCCSGKTLCADIHTLVKFRELSEREISAYVMTGEPDDKAGAYAVQGIGSLLIESINGDYYNVVGLPLCTLGSMLQDFGINLL